MQYLSRNSQSRKAMPVHALRYLPTHDATEIERSSKLNSTREKSGLLSEPSLPLILSLIPSRPVVLRSTVAQTIRTNQAVTNNQVLRNQYLRRQRPSSG